MATKTIVHVRKLIKRVSMEVLGVKFKVEAHLDKKYGKRMYLQVFYSSPCTKTGEIKTWQSGKNYLSDHMTDDEVIKKCYVTLEQAVKHEVMEGFKVDNNILFNPHTNFEQLLTVSSMEVART